MTIVDMLEQSGILTLLGMGVVFSFLIIMVICMNLLRAILHALKLDKDVQVEQKSTASQIQSAPSTSAAPAADNNAVVAAIAAAIHDKVLNS